MMMMGKINKGSRSRPIFSTGSTGREVLHHIELEDNNGRLGRTPEPPRRETSYNGQRSGPATHMAQVLWRNFKEKNGLNV